MSVILVSSHMPFDPIPTNQFPRRAFLIMPFAFAGLAAFCYPRQRKLLDASEDGNGPEFQLALFSKSGKCEAVRGIRSPHSR